MPPLFNALIRTHHITSRKKVAHLKKAAERLSCSVLLRSGGSPGIMYCEGSETSVQEFVSVVQKLRYKDFQLAARPATKWRDTCTATTISHRSIGLCEVPTVKEFASEMELQSILLWWRQAMGYIS
ncbi:hypothetical protein NA57DRAFT_46406 [Rhizodiscina lignyota]|uniref:Uncharacterized protein n=1 Tax=Rhizodiscina lignyota TaxID=1504668 RepID=A0A9P4I9A4_9PEZI|nr:hypothetical protein NA57DRAFT_46406 [Rhizodiscina lignyota]